MNQTYCIFTGLLLFTLGAPTLIAQTRQEYYDYRWQICEPADARFTGLIKRTDSGYRREDYFLPSGRAQMIGLYRDAECRIKNGWFHYFYATGTREGTGRYTEDRKDGLWLHYHPNGMMKDSGWFAGGKPVGVHLAWHTNGFIADSTRFEENGSGTQVRWFDNGNPFSAGYLTADGQPTGVWTYFHDNGITSAREVYENGKRISCAYFDESGQPQQDTSEANRDASYGAGEKAWQNYLTGRLTFPRGYRLENTAQVMVVLNFTIREDGQLSDAFVSVPFHPAFDEQALNVIRHAPRWRPAKHKNRRVPQQVSQSVVFEDPD